MQKIALKDICWYVDDIGRNSEENLAFIRNSCLAIFRALLLPETVPDDTAYNGMSERHVLHRMRGFFAMILATWNVNSITVRLEQVLSWLQQARPNVLCLQEIKVVDEKFPVKDFEALGYAVETFGEKTYNGVAIISDKPLTNVERGFVNEVGPGSKRLIAGSYDSVRIIDVYIPNGSEVGSQKYYYKLDWIQALRQYFCDVLTPQEHVLLCGDFNIATEDRDVYDPKLLAGTILVSDAERKAIGELADWGLTDVFRKHHSDAGLYSWWDYRMNAFRRNLGLRIDHIWTTHSLAERSRSIYIDKEPRKAERPSDHAPVVAEFDL